MPALKVARSSIAFFALFVYSVQVTSSPVAMLIWDFLTAPIFISFSKLKSKGAIWALSCFRPSSFKLRDLTSNFTSVLPASSRRASIIVWIWSVANPLALRSKAKDVNANFVSSAVALDKVLIVGAKSFLNASLSRSWSLLLLVCCPTTSLFFISEGSFDGTILKKSPRVLTWLVVVFIAFDKPYIASFSFSLALFINLVATMNAPIAIAAAPNLSNPIFLRLFNTFSPVNIWMIEDSANKGPVIVNNIWENLPKFPPAMEATPDRAESANVPDMNALFNEFILWFIAAVCFCAWVASNASLLNLAFAAISFMFIPGVVGMFLATDPGWPGALNGTCGTPPWIPVVAAFPNWDPTRATSSCLLFIPSSRPRPISSPVFLVFLDGDAVPAALLIALW